MLVALGLFSVASIGFYSVMFSGSRSTDTTESVVRTSEEARLGFNRLVRDTREGDVLGCSAVDPCPSATSFNVKVDFDGIDSDGNGVPYENPNPNGDYEDLVFSYRASDATLRINGEVLMRGVEPIAGKPLFTYSSNLLEYDWNGDGTTSWQELDEAEGRGVTGIGNGNRSTTSGPDAGEVRYISSVGFALQVRDGSQVTRFYSEAQLRNKR